MGYLFESSSLTSVCHMFLGETPDRQRIGINWSSLFDVTVETNFPSEVAIMTPTLFIKPREYVHSMKSNLIHHLRDLSYVNIGPDLFVFIIPEKCSHRDDKFIKFPSPRCGVCTMSYHRYLYKVVFDRLRGRNPWIPLTLTACTDRPTGPGNEAPPRIWGSRGCVTVIYITTRTPYTKFPVPPFPFRRLYETLNACDNEPLYCYNILNLSLKNKSRVL